jgi:plasmid stabilization system protein ParE
MIAFQFLPEAERELDAIVEHYEAAEPGLGTDFLDALSVTLQRARRFPRGGTQVAALSTTIEVRRYLLRRFPYKIIAAVRPDALIVVAVARGSRHPMYWLARLAKARG